LIGLKINKMNTRQRVVFCILMEGNNGILEKAPDYVEEKFERCLDMANPELLLDTNNLNKFKDYCNKWDIDY